LDPWSWDQYKPGSGPHQFYDLFRPDAAWPKAAAATDVMRLYPAWVDSYASSQQLSEVLTDLARRGIAVSFENGPLPESPACNAGSVEGFAGPPSESRIARRIQAAGATLRSMDLEHPFDAATYGPVGCRMTPADIARNVLESIATVRSIFPDVQVGSIETADMDVSAVAAWLEAYRQATGAELAYFHLDVDYARPDWAARAKQIENYVRSRGVAFGIIYTGAEDDPTDAAWVAHAQQRVEEYEVDTGGRPDHAVFQSWQRHPSRLLPETAPDAFTHLIDLYLRPRTRIEATRSANALSGTVRADGGAPIANVSVSASTEPTDGPGVLHTYTLSGTVPTGAHTADVGYRINTECGCSGPAALTFYQAEFHQGGETANRVPNPAFAHGLDSWGHWGAAAARLVDRDTGTGRALRVDAAPGQDAGLNSGLFRVDPGSPFTLSFTARVQPGTVASGYFDIVFLDGDRELTRSSIPITVVATPAGQARTDANGAFRLNLPPNLPDGVRLTIRFAGDDTVWPAATVIAP
jgi:hypothetical protein